MAVKMGDERPYKPLKYLIYIKFIRSYGGGSGIRTLGTLSRPPVFKTGAFDHSAKPPQLFPPNPVFLIRQTAFVGKHTVTAPLLPR